VATSELRVKQKNQKGATTCQYTDNMDMKGHCDHITVKLHGWWQ